MILYCHILGLEVLSTSIPIFHPHPQSQTLDNLEFAQKNLKGISTTSPEFSLISGYIFLYILDEIINATETNNMEQKIIIHTN